MNIAPQFILSLESSGLPELPETAAKGEGPQATFEIRQAQKPFGSVALLGQQRTYGATRPYHRREDRLDHGREDWKQLLSLLDELLRASKAHVGADKKDISYFHKTPCGPPDIRVIGMEARRSVTVWHKDVIALDPQPPSFWATELDDRWKKLLRTSTVGQAAFFYLEHARKLLNEQKIEAAKKVLRKGTKLHPDDRGIAELLRTISPGRVLKRKEKAVNRKKEMQWLKEHGKSYRGQWVAITEEGLLGSAAGLETLISQLGADMRRERSPLIQFISAE